MTVRKQQIAAAASSTAARSTAASSTAANSGRLKGQTLRLAPETWLKLKLLAAVLDAKRGRRVTQHDLLLEAVDDLLVKYRRDLPRHTVA